MIIPRGGKGKLDFISMEEIAPQDHLLQKIDRCIDFGFAKERLYPFTPHKKTNRLYEKTVCQLPEGARLSALFVC